MQTHRITLAIMAVAILCPCCYGASNLPPRIEGDLAVFFNGKLLDPQHTGFLTSCNFYLPVQIGHRLFEDPIHLDYDGVYVYPVHFETYEEEVDRRLSELEAETTNTQRLLDGLQAASFTNGPYKVDLTYALLGQFALFPTEDRTGCPVAGDQEGDISTCFEEFLDEIDRVTQGVILYVRGCEPVPVGLILRALQKRKIKVSLYYLDTNAPLKYSISRKKKDEQQRP